MELRLASLRFSDLFILQKRGGALNSRSKIQSKHSEKTLTPNPSPLKRGEGSKHKEGWRKQFTEKIFFRFA